MTHRSAIAGQGGGAWTPALPTPDGGYSAISWYDADAITGLADGDAVSAWTDMAGGFHATQSEPVRQPKYMAGILNGRPVVRFDGVNDFLQHTYSHGGSPCTVFAVATRTGGPNYTDLYSAAAPGDGQAMHILAKIGSSTSWGHYLGANIASSYSCLSQWRVMCVVVSSSTQLTMYTDGEAPEPKTGFRYYSESGDRRSIGGNLALRYYLPGDVAEIVTYGVALGADDVNRVRDYLNAKWAVYS